jgi:Dolichyl-phosphate-mannose-protein mannosyltransferase
MILGALFTLFAVRGLLAMQADGMTADEGVHLWYGERALRSGTFLRVHEMLNSKMPISVLNALPVAIAARLRATPLAARERLLLARLPSLLLAIVLGWLVFRWAQALYGWRSGALALFLYSWCPNVIAHAHLVTTDVATSLGIFAATFACWRYVERPHPARLWLAAGAFGAAQLTKLSALLLAPILVVLWLLRRLPPWRRPSCEATTGTPQNPGISQDAPDGRQHVGRAGVLLPLLCFGLATLVTLNVGFCFEGTGTPLARYTLVSPTLRSLAAVPLLRALPLPLPYAYVQGIDMSSRDASAPSWSYLRGSYHRHGFWNYFLVALLVKVPLSTQLLLALAVWLGCSGRVPWRRGEEFLLVPAVLLLGYFSLLFSLQIGLRYVLPIFPLLLVFISRVAAADPAAAPAPLDLAAQPRGPTIAGWRARWIAVGVLLAWNAASSLSIHPHYLAYFNELAGGPDHGAGWLIDSNLDWGQDSEYVRTVYAARGPVPVRIDPGGPRSGRIAVGLSHLVGLDPQEAARHAWLRNNFQPIANVGHSWAIFDVSEDALRRCCARLPLALGEADLDGDLALQGEPFAGGDGVTILSLAKLNDGMLGANQLADAAQTAPPRPHPVRAWFGIAWRDPHEVGRLVAFPGMLRSGPAARQFLALDYVFQTWDANRWLDIPGTRVSGNQSPRVEQVIKPIRTRGIRLLVERERNDRGEISPQGTFRAACLELAVYPR